MNSKIKTSFRRTNKKAARRSTETSFKRIKIGGERQGENLWDAMLRTQGSAGSSKNYNEIHRRIFGKFDRSGTNGKDAYTKFLNMTVSEDCPKRAPWVVR